MSFTEVLCEMAVLFFAVLCGCIANCLGYLGGQTDRKLAKLILNISLPCMILSSVGSGGVLPNGTVLLALFGVSAIFYLLEFLGILLLPRILGGTASELGVWRFALAFPNVGFIGYPVVTAIFGQEALLYAVLLALPFNLLSFTLGPLLLAGRSQSTLRGMLTPTVIASLSSLAITLTRCPLPALAGDILAFAGDMTVPLSLFLVGSLLAELGWLLPSLKLLVLSAVRLLVLPFALSIILHALSVDALISGIAVIQMAMPVAVNGSLLCMEYGGNETCMAQITFVSTLASVITIPLAAAWLI